ncbi:MAG: serine/threonine-protein kinase, partial [Anaerolineae bacterium]|nr:serine/threonine-protein kinase [Anaerolineae bacterium]
MGMNNLTGQTLGQYELRELLGVGGMGAVYRAYQHSLQRTVAVKVLRPELTSDPGYIERFTREARTSAALEHPNIIPVFDYGMQQDISYLVMRLLTGGSLSERLAARASTERPLPSLGEIADLLRQMSSALDYAHSQGVIHRDIKPSNVMFDNHGNAYLVDFGIAKLLEATATGLTGAGAVVGTFGYMAPEQWRNAPLTPATDQYALGVLAYSLVTGRMPFEAPTPAGVMHKHLSEQPTPPRVHRDDAPDALTPVIERALAKDGADRFPACTAFAQAFDGAIRGNTGERTAFFTAPVLRKPAQPPAYTPSPNAPVTVARPLHKTPAVWAMGVIIAVMAAVIAFLALGQGGEKGAGGLASAEQTGTALAALSAPTEMPTVPALVTATPLASDTPRPTETSEPTATDTPPPTNTVIPVPTDTPQPTMTDIPQPTATLTPAAGLIVQPSATRTPTLTLTPSATRTRTPTLTLTPSITPTPTATVDAREIARQTRSALLTQTATQWTLTPSLTPTPTLTPTLTLTYTATPNLEATIAFELTQLHYEDATATATLWTPTPAPTRTNTATPTPVLTPTPQPITSANAERLVELQRLGRGTI